MTGTCLSSQTYQGRGCWSHATSGGSNDPLLAWNALQQLHHCMRDRTPWVCAAASPQLQGSPSDSVSYASLMACKKPHHTPHSEAWLHTDRTGLARWQHALLADMLQDQQLQGVYSAHAHALRVLWVLWTLLTDAHMRLAVPQRC